MSNRESKKRRTDNSQLPEGSILGWLDSISRARLRRVMKTPPHASSQTAIPPRANLPGQWLRTVLREYPQQMHRELLKTVGLRFLILYTFVDDRERRRVFLDSLRHSFTREFFLDCFPPQLENNPFFHSGNLPAVPPQFYESDFLSLELIFQRGQEPPYLLLSIHAFFKIMRDHPEQWQLAAPEQLIRIKMLSGGNLASANLIPDRLLSFTENSDPVDPRRISRISFQVFSISIVQDFLFTILCNKRLIPYLNLEIIKKSSKIPGTVRVPPVSRMTEQQIKRAMDCKRSIREEHRDVLGPLLDSFYGRASEVFGVSFR